MLRAARRWPVLLIAGAIVLPMLLFGLIAWDDRASVMEQAEQNVVNTTRTYEEHARNLFETHSLVANLIDQRIRGMTWQEIADSEEIWLYLRRLVQRYPQIQSLWLADRTGAIRNGSAGFPPPQVGVSDRDYFRALRGHGPPLFIGQLVHGRVFADDIFNVAIRRSAPSGEFDGVIVVSALPSYFIQFWNHVDPRPGAASTLIRRDGVILARDPPNSPQTPPLTATSAFLQAIESADSGFRRVRSSVDGVERLFAFQKVEGFPVYVGHGDSVDEVLGVWRTHMARYGILFGAAALLLTTMAVITAWEARREAVALEKWRRTAKELGEEIEHRAAIEEHLRQSQKMEALGQITGGIAHDFRNVLTVVMGTLELLKDRVTASDAKLIRLATDAANRGMGAIKTMLAFARHHPLCVETLELNTVLDGMEPMLRQALGSGIPLKRERGAADCSVQADENQLELAILNICLNARDAMPAGGTLTLRADLRELTGDPAGLMGTFGAVTIRDTGTGMAAEVAAKAFEPFFTTKGPEKGTGLGLSMVHGFAQQSHGAATISSTAGRGTTVVLYLPAASAGRTAGHTGRAGTATGPAPASAPVRLPPGAI
ncbi:MAG: hypothetical protein JSR21_14240 [Proteobacteria bacterium]|nr:hypothetical protein [Pseudomonadota bacterium]